MNQEKEEKSGENGTKASPEAKAKLTPIAHVMCGWPLLLVAIGGALGGGLGFAAYVINRAIYRSKLPVPAKVVLNILVGLSAIGIWMVIGVAIQSAIS